MSMTPYFSIIIGVALSVIFCVAFSCWTRRHRRRHGCAASAKSCSAVCARSSAAAAAGPAHALCQSCRWNMMPRHLPCRSPGTRLSHCRSSHAEPVHVRSRTESGSHVSHTGNSPHRESRWLTCAVPCASRRGGDFLSLQMGSRRQRAQRGVPQEVLATLPCHEFKASELAAPVPSAEAPLTVEAPALDSSVAPVTFCSRAVTAPDVAANECSVCLAEYEEGEMVRTLVNCSHMFHQKVRAFVELPDPAL